MSGGPVANLKAFRIDPGIFLRFFDLPGESLAVKEYAGTIRNTS